ncbi:RICIN domain-containing protein [Collinsella tanakaei]|uniref:RICIN domain-containing protein n=1 Tax=Collinsella tanakaei TaxID=626935 RepID=UPI0025A3AB88|nr:RICIN domain-containing protein [Collinsella tanakaei]MDM8299840.1 RICIN domain-containing protein [Collinsella tanakaei]
MDFKVFAKRALVGVLTITLAYPQGLAWAIDSSQESVADSNVQGDQFQQDEILSSEDDLGSDADDSVLVDGNKDDSLSVTESDGAGDIDSSDEMSNSDGLSSDNQDDLQGGFLESAEQSADVVENDVSNDDAQDDKNGESFFDTFAGNSWRYSDGALISDYAREGLVSWKKNSDGTFSFSNGIKAGDATAIGIDVSEFNYTIDWQKVKDAGVDYAIIRIGWGWGGLDKTFETNVRGALDAGVPIGVYLYSYAWDEESASDEADWALEVLSDVGITPSDLSYPVYYDIENADKNGVPAGVDDNNTYRPIDGRFAEMAQEFCGKISAAGYTPGVYSSLSWWESYFTDSCFEGWNKWVAQYYTSCTYEQRYDHWQCTSIGSVPGISGAVDLNLEYGGIGPVENYKDVIPDGSYSIRVSNSSASVLDVQGASVSENAYVNLWTRKSAGDNQVWNVTHDHEGYVILENAYSGLVLSVKGEAKKNARVIQTSYRDGDMLQRWIVVPRGSSYSLYSAADTSLVLDASRSSTANGTWVALYPANGGKNQRWFFDSDMTMRDRLDELASNNRAVLADGDYAIKPSYATSLCLDVQGASSADGAKVNLWEYGGRTNQVWTVSHDEDGYITFVNYSSGKVLDSSGPTSMRQRTSNGGWSQKWIALKCAGYIQLISAENDSLVLDVRRAGSTNGTETIMYSKGDAAKNQLWQFESVSARRCEINDLAYEHANDMKDGTYTFASVNKDSAVADVQGASTSNSANVNLWTYDGSPNQAWKITHDSKGYITITNVYSSKVLDVQGGKDSVGARLIQYTSNGGWNQKWIAVKSGNGIKLVSAMGGGYVLSRSGGASSNGTKIVLAKDNGSQSLEWIAKAYTLTPSQYPYKGFQNPSNYYQVSNRSVSIKNQGVGIHGYATSSKIGWKATRQDCVNAMITRSMDYLNTPYIWDYSCAPGVGVDCAGLVMQALYATGMDLSPMNPWDHYYTPGHDQYANYMWTNGRFQKVSWSNRQPGDIVSSAGHVQIYIGSNKIIEAYSPSVGVRIKTASSSGVRGLLRPFYKK